MNIRSALKGSLDENATVMNKLLDEAIQVLNENPELKQRVGYNILEKGEKDKKRYNKFLHYPGSDSETIRLLEEHHEEWKEDPGKFWNPPASNDCIGLDPGSQLVFEFQKWRGQEAVNLIAYTLHAHGRLHRSRDELKDTVDDMIDLGYRYKNIENEIGPGTPLVLGNSISTSSWKKDLPKKGEKFTNAMSKIRDTNVPALAKRYENLSKGILNWQMEHVKRRGFFDFRSGESQFAESQFDGSQFHSDNDLVMPEFFDITDLMDASNQQFSNWGM